MLLQLRTIIFLAIYVPFVCFASIAKSIKDITGIFEGLGYSPVCVASALVSCERFASLAKSKKDITGIFEGLGYSPVCVVSALASCERFAMTDCDLHVMLELKSLFQEKKCNNKNNSVTVDEIKVKEILNFEGPKVPNNFNKNITKITSTVEEIKRIVSDLKIEKFEHGVEIKNLMRNLTTFHEDLLVVKESMKCQMSSPIKTDFASSSYFDLSKKATNCAVACGVRMVNPSIMEDKPLLVSCDERSDGGGWTVIQNRDSAVTRQNFYRTWSDYVKGFGDISGEFWLGLDNIHDLTNLTEMELRIDLEDFEGEKRWAKYASFRVGGEHTKYSLSLGNYSGNAGDSLSYQNGMKFSTHDQDNDEATTRHCAQNYQGAWWYKACYQSNLNGYPYAGKLSSLVGGINWRHFRGDSYSLKKTSMKLRPKSGH